METVFLALGSNLGDRKNNLLQAMDALSKKVEIDKYSSIYETPPWGYKDQPSFLNQVIQGQTALEPHHLLKFCKTIENKMGRVKTVRFGPRLIDIDILLYGQQIITLPDLEIPHPRMLERAFVLVPLNEVQPALVIPSSGQTVQKALAALDISDIQKIDPNKSI